MRRHTLSRDERPLPNMKVLLSSIGSRGDVQPILALAVELRRLGHDAALCVAPNFKEWIESFGVECVPIGPDLRKMTGGTVSGKPALPSPEQLQLLAEQMVRNQFHVIGEASGRCDVILAAGALQIATRSIAEVRKVPYIFAAYCPAVLPSSMYPPPTMGGHHSFSLSADENEVLWQQDAQGFKRFAATLNEERARIGLASVQDVRSHVFTERPWLAADPVLAPGIPRAGIEVVQTGAWLLDDESPLPDDLEEFLSGGSSPVYLGFGSMRASDATAGVLIDSLRALRLRAIISRGWADLSASEAADDILWIGDLAHAKLFPRVAAIVHHGGSGTTTAAAIAGRPQVIVPHNYDQFYWAHRVQQMGVGVAGPMRDDLTVDGLVEAVRECLKPEIAQAAQALAGRIERHGAQRAAQRLLSEFG
jgi:vancomycin aglycone glucosyltransferase